MDQFNGSVVLGTNMVPSENATWATQYLNAVNQLIGWSRVKAIGKEKNSFSNNYKVNLIKKKKTQEIGNEPDLFAGNGIRNNSFTYDQYVTQFGQYIQSIIKQVAGLPSQKIFQGGKFILIQLKKIKKIGKLENKNKKN